MSSTQCVLALLLVAASASLNAHPKNPMNEKELDFESVPVRDGNSFHPTRPMDGGVRLNVTPESYTIAWRSEFLGKKVQAEGVAWGKATAQRIIMDRSEVRVVGCRFSDNDAGKLVRVTGTLEYHPATASRFATLQPYFYIQTDSYKVIDRLSCPALKGFDNTVTRIEPKAR